MKKQPFFSIIVPFYNSKETIVRCIRAINDSNFRDYEIIAVDDGSTDNGLDMIADFDIHKVVLKKNSGPSIARNYGANNANGNYLVFIDADCYLHKNTLSLTKEIIDTNGEKIIGGTYDFKSFDNNFVSNFQSLFINFFETKKDNPGYIATHYFVIKKEYFDKTTGFTVDGIYGRKAILEDVEFSRLLRNKGYKLKMYKELRVVHHFGFNFLMAIKNAFLRSYSWTRYSIVKGNLNEDSGASSHELKSTGLLFLIFSIGIILGLVNIIFLLIPLIIFEIMIIINLRFFKFLISHEGLPSGCLMILYYLFIFIPSALLGGIFSISKLIFNEINF